MVDYRAWKHGERVIVNASPGMGTVPPHGTKGVVETQREDGTVLVAYGDGRRGIFASWELSSDN